MEYIIKCQCFVGNFGSNLDDNLLWLAVAGANFEIRLGRSGESCRDVICSVRILADSPVLPSPIIYLLAMFDWIRYRMSYIFLTGCPIGSISWTKSTWLLSCLKSISSGSHLSRSHEGRSFISMKTSTWSSIALTIPSTFCYVDFQWSIEVNIFDLWGHPNV